MEKEQTFTPNYLKKCGNCDSFPTVTINQDDGTTEHSELCGCCYFGEAACLDPDEWQ